MKRIGAIALLTLLTGGVVGSTMTFAEERTTVISEVEKDTTNYMKFTGVIQEIETSEKGNMVTVVNEDDLIMVLSITDDALLLNSDTTEQMKKDEFKKGSIVEAYYDKIKPMILIYPAQVTPEIVVLKGDIVGEVKIAKFDDVFLSLDNELKLNIGEDTILLNQKGETIEEADLHNKELAVFYSATTRSIPPQTSPSKIIALDYVTEEMVLAQEIIEADHYVKNGVKMIPLRKVAEKLGYHVEAQARVSGALITKENRSFMINRGKVVYGFNKSIGKFEIAPELKDKKTYVPIAFLDLLLEK
ncbi:stalk domain-containing protein [Sporosarcina siberiensis]|uniref:Stalk domain-containing protein n=1 Tax=Sporosarcina siberiensis TaxID=1365606 RepID=A0ABW4SGT4_9BACL